jgi:hypothetical protein
MKEEKIKDEAKQIMDRFMAELGEIKLTEEFGLVREEQIREPKETMPDEDFKERMLKNAPKVRGDSIVAEKKNW